jgi:predicted nucleic acid-binding protein
MEEVVADPIHFSLGLVDAQVLWLAAKEKGILLTGDLPLRQEAERRKVSVHGLLWILAQMIGAGKLEPPAAAKALRIMMAKGARLPASECERLLRGWEK